MARPPSELVRSGSGVLAHIGARGTAFSNVELLDRLFDFDEIRVTSRRPESRDAFGALRPHVRAGLLSEETLYAELGEIVAGLRPGRERADERILFWHRGLGTTDVALADLLYRRALERGVGTMVRYR